MKIKIICIGKIKNQGHQTLQAYYLKKLSFQKLELIELADGKEKDPEKRLFKESERILEKIKPGEEVYLLDELGKNPSSIEFSKRIEEHQNQSVKGLCFIIGSSHGIHHSLKQKIKRKIGLSQMTLTHEMARVFLLEQIYRAFAILSHSPYHH